MRRNEIYSRVVVGLIRTWLSQLVRKVEFPIDRLD